MYSAYDAPLSQKIQSLIAAFGIISFVIIFITGLFSFLYKKHRTNYICMWSMLISESIMFWQVQNMAVQHRMILNLPIFICFILLFSFWSSSISKRFISRTIIVGCVLLQLFNFAKAFAPFLPVSGKFQIFAERYYPFQRNDLDALRQLDTKLNSLTSGTNDYVYVAASGWFLNDSILQCIDAPATDRAVPNMFNSNHIDLRDGFPTDFLQARYVVTTTPIQTHLTSGQEVITYLSDSVQNSSNYLGIHFQKIYQIELDNHVVAEVYEKVSDFTQDDLSKLRAYFCTLYPDSPELFADRIQ